MLKIIASGLIAAATLSLSACPGPNKDDKPNQTSQVLRTTIGDGSWIVGDELAPGIWQAKDDITKKSECAWFVTPAKDPSPGASPTQEPSSSNIKVGRVAIRLHPKEGFTTYKCGEWEKIG